MPLLPRDRRLPALHAVAALALSLCFLLAPPARGQGEPVTVLAVGDIAFCERSLGRRIGDWFAGLSGQPGAPATAALLDGLPGTVLALGDLVYWEGTAEEFAGCYDPTWGRHKGRTRPVPGNHEYRTPEASPYYAYWGAQAGEPGQGYYSYDLGAWHLVALNSNLEAAAMDAQLDWLERVLAATRARCILAYWHHPLFSSGKHGDSLRMLTAYDLLYEAGASLVLAGHDHNYERFARMDPVGGRDPERGIRSFVVGTGGGQLKPHKISDPPRENSELVDGSSWGLLELTLHAERYDWRFVPVEGHSLKDSGSAACVERP